MSPAIYTTRAQDLGSVVVDSSLACLAFGRVGEHTSLYWQYGTLQAAAPTERPPVERARPHYIPFRVLPWSQPNLAQRSGVPGDVRYLRTMYGEYEINALVELEQQLCSCCSWAGTSSTLVSWWTLGRCPSFHGGPLRRVGRSKNIHNEKVSTFHETLEVGVKDAVRFYGDVVAKRVQHPMHDDVVVLLFVVIIKCEQSHWYPCNPFMTTN